MRAGVCRMSLLPRTVNVTLAEQRWLAAFSSCSKPGKSAAESRLTRGAKPFAEAPSPMLGYCLFLIHWSVFPPAEVAVFLFIFVFFSVLFSLEICTRLLRCRSSERPLDPHVSPANPRVQSVCDGIRRNVISSSPHQDTDQEATELCGHSELLRQ